MATVRELEKIGIRLAGSKGEKAAANWIERELRKLGLTGINQQEFPCLTFGHSKCEVSTFSGGKWTKVNSEPAALSPPTTGDGLTGELAVVEDVPPSAEKCRDRMNDKVVLIYGSLLMHRANLRNVMKAKPKAVLVVDERFHGDWTVSFGFPRNWAAFLTSPVLNIPYLEAWDLVKRKVERVRVRLDSFVREATSQNVIGEIKGTSMPGEVIVISGHHDTVANNPGVDDNGTGVAAVLALARFFSQTPPKRTLRFISYGTEEQLSEGALYYARNVADAAQIRMVLNVDSIGAVMGQTSVFCTGKSELARFVKEINQETGFPGHIDRKVIPFSDHFPLNLRNVASVWYYRQTYAAGRHFHHSPLETVDVLSAEILEQTVRHQACLLHRVSNADPLPFPSGLTRTQRRELKQAAREWIGCAAL
jgi:hypothetical protein